MSYEVGTAYLNILPSFDGLQREIERAMGGVDSNRAGRAAGEGYTSGLKSVAAKLTGVLAGAFAAVKVTDFAKDAIANASDLNEVASKINVVFGEGAAQVQAFGAQGAKALGQTSLQAQNAAATFGVFGKSAGLADKENAAFSTNLAKLATDMASFSNTTPEDAIDALAAGLRGENEPLQRYGVLLDDASLRQEALAQGLITTTKDALTPQQKVLAANALIMKQTTDAQGDFARTSGGLANQQRILNAQWEESKGKLGQVFLPMVTDVVTALNDKLFPVLEGAGAKVGPAIDNLKGAFHTLTTGDFDPSTWGAGVEEDSPLVDFIFKVRDVALPVFDRLQGIWEKVKSAAIEMWPSIQSIAKSLGEAGASVGLSSWGLFLGFLDSAADALKDYLVPALDWLAGFMRDNPGLVGAVVAAWAGWKVATMAITLVTSGLTAAQTLLNAVMRANPIVLVITALAALAAAVIWAYNNVDWFREAVDTAWEFIKNASTVLWENFLKPFFEKLWEIIQWVADKLVWFWQNIVEPAWAGISNAIQWAWENVIQPVLGWLRDAISNTGEFFSNLWQTVSNVWTWISDKVTTVWNWIRDNVFAPLQTGISSVGTFFSNLWTTVSDVWTWIGDKIQGIWDNVINPIWTKIQEFIKGIGAFFSGIWDGVKNVVQDVKSFIDEITTKIDDFFGKVQKQAESQGIATGSGPTTAGPFSSAGNPLAGMGMYAAGGVLPGIDRGYDDQIIAARSGEAVMVPQFARAMGGEAGINALNRAAERGMLPGFSEGGIVGLHTMGMLTGDILKKASKDLLAAKRDQILSIPLFSTIAGGLNPSQDPSSFGWQRAAGIVPFSWNGTSIVGGVAGGTQGLWSGLLSALVPQIPGGLMSPIWGYENRNIAGTGTPSFHSYGLAIDINAPQNGRGLPGYGRTGQGVIPGDVAHSLAAQFGMMWGGDWSYTDPMHFEIHVSPNQISGGSVNAAPAAAVVGGSGVERWRSTVLQALAFMGEPAYLADTVLNQIRTESSGNPQAINLWDRNAMMGTPSKGLVQVIDPTFARYAMAPYNTNIWDPISNIIAGANYARNTYGSIARGMRGVAYDQGGWLMPGGQGVNLLNRPEAVLTPPQSQALVTHAKALEAGFAGQMPTLHLHLDDSDPLQVAVGEMIQGAWDRAEFELTTIGARR